MEVKVELSVWEAEKFKDWLAQEITLMETETTVGGTAASLKHKILACLTVYSMLPERKASYD